MKILIVLLFSFYALISTAQTKVVTGNVYAFCDLKLNHIAVTAQKENVTVFTDQEGNFSIECHKNDRLKFTGAGFQKVVISVKDRNYIQAKMIYYNSEKSKNAAVRNHHLALSDLELCLRNESFANQPGTGYWRINGSSNFSGSQEELSFNPVDLPNKRNF
jgi:hypothetical protein